jgi:hypothetical protein
LNVSKREDTFDVKPDDLDYMRHLDRNRRKLEDWKKRLKEKQRAEMAEKMQDVEEGWRRAKKGDKVKRLE